VRSKSNQNKRVKLEECRAGWSD